MGADPRYDSFSAFTDDEGARGLALKRQLDASYVDTVVVLGLPAEWGVASTALDAALLDYRTILLRGASRVMSEAKLEERLPQLRKFGVTIV